MSELVVEFIAHLLDLCADSGHPFLVLLEDLDKELTKLALELAVDRRRWLRKKGATARVGEVAHVWEKVGEVKFLVSSSWGPDLLLDG